MNEDPRTIAMMNHRQPRSTRPHTREPTNTWIWITFFLLTFLSVPFFFAGRIEPLLFDIPLWFFISLLCYLLMAILLVFVIIRHWHLAGPTSIRSLSADYWSLLLIGGIGAALYPHAIQRLYAARSEWTLKTSLALLAFIPFLTVLSALIIGIIGIAVFPGLAQLQSDQIFPLLPDELSRNYYWLALVLYTGAMAQSCPQLTRCFSPFPRFLRVIFIFPSSLRPHPSRRLPVLVVSSMCLS
jgi:hypothetical protein